ncbi:MAG: 1-deoxy-D-xylulose-5-phosphate synthase [Erysipelotrichales bacterium]|nr:1-deoxy-D-xylulose-5-phosphate synthase [Erysipelotrichales bacterium]
MSKELRKFNINEIENPEFLKDLSIKELELLCASIRDEIINKTSINGGHVASNLGVVELTVALHNVFDFKKDKLLLDVGHQCYAHKILTGRSLEHLRKKDGISGFQKCHESIYDCFEAGHSSTSLSAAYGMAVVRDQGKENYDVVAVIGDGAITSGLAFEGLNNIGRGDSKVIIIFNDNEMSISKSTGGIARFLQRIRTSVSYNKRKKAYQRFMCKTRFGLWIFKISAKIKNRFKKMFLSSNIFDTMGFAYIGPIDGHNMKELLKALKQAKKSSKSVVIHTLTTKGKGYKYAEADKDGVWHGVPPFNVETGEFIKNNNYPSWSKEIASLVYDFMKNHDDTILINPAMIQGSELGDIFKDFKARCYDVGICESHAFSMASGVALNGYHPIISIYSTFMQRAFDEIQQDLARMNLNCTILVDRAGLVGADGETHQGIFDESMLYTIPNVTISMPSNKSEAKILLDESYNNHGVFAIRYPRDYLKNNNNVSSFKYGEWLNVNECESDDVIVTFGPIINDVKELFPHTNIVNAIYQKPILKENVEKLLKYKRIIIYNPYATKEGFVNNFVEMLTLYYYRGEIVILAVKEDFIKAGTQSEQMKEVGVSLEHLKAKLNSDKGVN